jgi:ribonuclease P protein component
MRDRSELTLRRQRDFSRVYNKGKSRGSKYVVVLYKENGLGFTRTAFVASKKVGNSVDRNRARRIMREAWRSYSDQIVQGYDIVFVARNTISGQKEKEVEKNLKTAVQACGLLKKH